MRIGVDLMGSDRDPEELAEAVTSLAAELNPEVTLVLLHTPQVNAAFTSSKEGACLEALEVPESIQMSEPPLKAVRSKKQSSLLQGIRLLAQGELDALVSAGNTGAIIAAATLFLTKLPGIDRPALLAQIPTATGQVTVLDVGGNVTWKARHLVQFAALGAAYQRACFETQCPRIGLLNVGAEAAKGHPEVREVYHQLKAYCSEPALNLEFCGNVEGRNVFRGAVDILVTDGFTGNVFLKTAEGVSSFILEQLQAHLSSLESASLREAVEDMERVVSYSEAGGALVCGVKEVLVKCHGHSSSRAVKNGVRRAIATVEGRLTQGLEAQLRLSGC